jgi:hypothetical protein
MDQEIACPELLCRAKRWGHVPKRVFDESS